MKSVLPEEWLIEESTEITSENVGISFGFITPTNYKDLLLVNLQISVLKASFANHSFKLNVNSFHLKGNLKMASSYYNVSFVAYNISIRFRKSNSWKLFLTSLFLPTMLYNLPFFSSPLYYVWETLVIVQIFDVWFLADLHVLESGEYKKHKISMVSGWPGVR